MRIKKYYCTTCEKFKSYAPLRYGHYHKKRESRGLGGMLEGYIRCCPYCGDPVVNVHERIKYLITALCSVNEYETKRDRLRREQT